jgi:hypothetical protein
MSQLNEAARFFDDHGWALITNVFSLSEIERFRDEVLRSELERRNGDLLSNAYLRAVVLDDRVIAISRALLGGEPTYFGDSTWTCNRTVPSTIGFHKDNPDKTSGSKPDWQTRKYPVLRMGIYLQDHVRHSGGLGLRDRSHQTHDCSVGSPFAVPTAKGDIVIWSLRTSHTGFASRLRMFPKVFLPMGMQGRLALRAKVKPPGSRTLFRPAEYPERAALFASFGIEGSLLQRYTRYLKTRRYAVELWKHSEYTDGVRADAARKGLALIDMPAQVREVDPLTVPEEHHELS